MVDPTPALPDIVLSVDYQQTWPLSDVMWPGPRPDWDALLSAELRERLLAWAAFFNQHADWETGSYGSEERRRWFDLEGVRLLYLLEHALEGKYRVKLNLWF